MENKHILNPFLSVELLLLLNRKIICNFEGIRAEYPVPMCKLKRHTDLVDRVSDWPNTRTGVAPEMVRALLPVVPPLTQGLGAKHDPGVFMAGCNW